MHYKLNIIVFSIIYFFSHPRDRIHYRGECHNYYRNPDSYVECVVFADGGYSHAGYKKRNRDYSNNNSKRLYFL